MKVCILVLLAVLAVVVAAEDEVGLHTFRADEGTVGVRLMKRILGVQRFFKEDPLGKKIVEQLEDLLSIMGQARQRLRHRLANYLKNLEE
nr:unnamed protein product [Spirometra erinaceieuropaei]